MYPLVSIIIPCYNAERYVAEAIQSSLDQTYPSREVIVIDDGSTDGSLEVIKSFDGEIRWETGPNRGACHARNRGFAMSHGDYVQFLDADDYLLPGKIAADVEMIRRERPDMMYGDWRHQYQQSQGNFSLGEVVVSGKQPDVLEALLGRWWVAQHALLISRTLVERIGGWDENLAAAQDRDFCIRAAMEATSVAYVPECHAVYRRYGNVTVSSSNLLRQVRCYGEVTQKVEEMLREQGRLTKRYGEAISTAYFHVARVFYHVDRDLYLQMMHKVRELHPSFRPQEGRLYNLSYSLFGAAMAERLALYNRRLGFRKVGGFSKSQKGSQ